MIIVGAKGFAKEVCEIFLQSSYKKEIAFFDNINSGLPKYLFEKYPVLTDFEQVGNFMQLYGNEFVLGIGTPILRYKMVKLFEENGASLESIISQYAQIGKLGNVIHSGCNIMTGSVITSDIEIKKGVLINLNCTIGHDVQIGTFAELSPGVHISGHVKIGDFSVLGTGAVVIPKVTIGKNSIIAAGCVVTKDVPDNVLVAGIPGKIIKELEPLEV